MFTNHEETAPLSRITTSAVGLQTAIKRLEKCLQCPLCGILVKSANHLVLLEEDISHHQQQSNPQRLQADEMNNLSTDNQDETSCLLPPSTKSVVCSDCWKNHHHKVVSIYQQEVSRGIMDTPTLAQILTQNANRFLERNDKTMTATSTTTESPNTKAAVDPFRLLRTMKQLYQQLQGHNNSSNNDRLVSKSVLPPPLNPVLSQETLNHHHHRRHNHGNKEETSMGQVKAISATINRIVPNNKKQSQQCTELEGYDMESEVKKSRTATTPLQNQDPEAASSPNHGCSDPTWKDNDRIHDNNDDESPLSTRLARHENVTKTTECQAHPENQYPSASSFSNTVVIFEGGRTFSSARKDIDSGNGQHDSPSSAVVKPPENKVEDASPNKSESSLESSPSDTGSSSRQAPLVASKPLSIREDNYPDNGKSNSGLKFLSSSSEPRKETRERPLAAVLLRPRLEMNQQFPCFMACLPPQNREEDISQGTFLAAPSSDTDTCEKQKHSTPQASIEGHRRHGCGRPPSLGQQWRGDACHNELKAPGSCPVSTVSNKVKHLSPPSQFRLETSSPPSDVGTRSRPSIPAPSQPDRQQPTEMGNCPTAEESINDNNDIDLATVEMELSNTLQQQGSLGIGGANNDANSTRKEEHVINLTPLLKAGATDNISVLKESHPKPTGSDTGKRKIDSFLQPTDGTGNRLSDREDSRSSNPASLAATKPRGRSPIVSCQQRSDDSDEESMASYALPETADFVAVVGPRRVNGVHSQDQFHAHSSIQTNTQSAEESISTYMLPETADFVSPSFRDKISGDGAPCASSSSESIVSSHLPETADFTTATIFPPGVTAACRKKARFHDNEVGVGIVPTSSPHTAGFFETKAPMDSVHHSAVVGPGAIKNDNDERHDPTMLVQQNSVVNCSSQSDSAHHCHPGECADVDAHSKRKSSVACMTPHVADDSASYETSETTPHDFNAPKRKIDSILQPNDGTGYTYRLSKSKDCFSCISPRSAAAKQKLGGSTIVTGQQRCGDSDEESIASWALPETADFVTAVEPPGVNNSHDQLCANSSVQSNCQSTGESISTYMLPRTAGLMRPIFRDQLSGDCAPSAFSPSESIVSSRLPETTDFTTATSLPPDATAASRIKAPFHHSEVAPTKAPSVGFFKKKSQVYSSDGLASEGNGESNDTGGVNCSTHPDSTQHSHPVECPDINAESKQKSSVPFMKPQIADASVAAGTSETTPHNFNTAKYADSDEESTENFSASYLLPETGDFVAGFDSTDRRRDRTNAKYDDDDDFASDPISRLTTKTAEIPAILEGAEDSNQIMGQTSLGHKNGKHSFKGSINPCTETTGPGTPARRVEPFIAANPEAAVNFTATTVGGKLGPLLGRDTEEIPRESQEVSIASTGLPETADFIATAPVSEPKSVSETQGSGESVETRLLPETSEFFPTSTVKLNSHHKTPSPCLNGFTSVPVTHSGRFLHQESPVMRAPCHRVSSLGNQRPGDLDACIQGAASGGPSLLPEKEPLDSPSPPKPSHICFDKNQSQPQSQLSHRLSVEESGTMSVLTNTYNSSGRFYEDEPNPAHLPSQHPSGSASGDAGPNEDENAGQWQVEGGRYPPGTKEQGQKLNRIGQVGQHSSTISSTTRQIESFPFSKSHFSNSPEFKLNRERVQYAEVTPSHFQQEALSRNDKLKTFDGASFLNRNARPQGEATHVTPSYVDDTRSSRRRFEVVEISSSREEKLVLADILRDDLERKCLEFLNQTGIIEMLPSDNTAGMHLGDRREVLGSSPTLARNSATRITLVTYGEKLQPPVTGDGNRVSFPTPLSEKGENRSILVCFRSFNFLMARALGHSVISSDCLQQSKKTGRWEGAGFQIWGDSTLYNQVVEGRSWLKSADWWDQPCFSPSDSSVARSQSGKPLLDDFKIVVLNTDCNSRGHCSNTQPDELGQPSSLGDYQDEKLLEGSVSHIDCLSSRNIETLCSILGAVLLESQIGPNEDIIVLVSDLVDDDLFEREWFPELEKRNILPPGSMLETDCTKSKYRSSRIKFCYFSWIADSVCANILAPTEPYLLGFVP